MSYRSKLEDYLADHPSMQGAAIFADGMHSVAHPSYFDFVAGASPVADRNCLFVTAEGETLILTNLSRDVKRLQRHAEVDEVRATDSFDADLQSVVSDLELEGTVGVAGADRMPLGVRQSLDGAVAELTAIDDALYELTRGKTAEEIAIFRKLGRIADRGFEAAYDALRPGVKEYEIAASIEKAMRDAGAEDNFNLLGSGERNDLMHSPTERIVEGGDTFLCELSPMYEGFVLQICRTISVGSPNGTLTTKYQLLEEALAETKSKLRPGVPAATISKTMNDVFRREGYDEYCQPPYMRTRGHEFGIGPIGMAITEDTDVELTDGMVVVIHPNQYIPETGYLALGDPVLITEGGSETLTETPPRLFTKEVVQ
ncbi:M24 family metallopeptidase [Halobellus salinisoli]|uniref:M24 family metallopeptidase n=1 Tax=Halobellus salinisoli TaxID=3108500 RepID=UPI00300B182B